MSRMALPRFALSADERVVAGVCSGIARALGVDVTFVRLVFAVLALAGGAGILLYLTLWAYAKVEGRWRAALLALVAGALLLFALGFSGATVAGIALVAGGLAIALRQGGSLRPDAPVSYGGLALAGVGAAIALPGGTPTVLAPGAVAGAVVLLVAPWLWRLALDRDAERAARVRSEERSEMAARVHDSVLQTLALIQRHAQEPQRVAALARRQERELRGWLYDDRPLGEDAMSLGAALSAAAAEIEEVHGVRVELASAGDCPLDDPVPAVVLAAREAMANAAKFAGVDEIDVYAEVTDEAVAVFVRDRGSGFDRAAVPADRRGLVESIEGRLQRAGGRATIVSAPGEGTEVELRLPRGAGAS
jgi:signal transduction histidine kinase